MSWVHFPQAVGFVDPRTKETRTIPLEVMVEGDKTPEYGETLEDLGRYASTGSVCYRRSPRVRPCLHGHASICSNVQFFS